MILVNQRIDLLINLAQYISENNNEWQEAKDRAKHANAWFTAFHIELAIKNIVEQFLQKQKLQNWINQYKLPLNPKLIGIVMAGNIPLVGFHDFICGFISGHRLLLKLSSKDEVLMNLIITKLTEWRPELKQQIMVAQRLNGCDAYIATGSNNTARYFKQYFGKYPHIIRKNRTSVAILNGTETITELAALADDVYLYYGLGCRNVTQVFVPKGYDFILLLTAFKKHDTYADLNKYKNNYDYHLAIYLLNRIPYMSNESILMVENDMPFSAVSVLHYKYYVDKALTIKQLKQNTDIQAIIGKDFIPFGTSQQPALDDYADGIDTMAFLCGV